MGGECRKNGSLARNVCGACCAGYECRSCDRRSGLWPQRCEAAQQSGRILPLQKNPRAGYMPGLCHAQPVARAGKRAPAKQPKRPPPQASPLPRSARGYLGGLHAKAKARSLEHGLLDCPAAQALAVPVLLVQGQQCRIFPLRKGTGVGRGGSECLGIQPQGGGSGCPSRSQRAKGCPTAVAEGSLPARKQGTAPCVHACLGQSPAPVVPCGGGDEQGTGQKARKGCFHNILSTWRWSTWRWSAWRWPAIFCVGNAGILLPGSPPKAVHMLPLPRIQPWFKCRFKGAAPRHKFGSRALRQWRVQYGKRVLHVFSVFGRRV